MKNLSNATDAAPVAPSTTSVPEYADTRYVAHMTGFSVKALEAMRQRGRGARFFVVGRHIRYRINDVRAWIESGSDPKKFQITTPSKKG